MPLKLKTFFTLSFIGLLFNNFSVASAKQNEIREVGFDECPICYDQDMINSLTQECPSLPTVIDFNNMDDEGLMCLCNVWIIFILNIISIKINFLYIDRRKSSNNILNNTTYYLLLNNISLFFEFNTY